MGQSLLARHEAYMASAERDRSEFTARVEELERENKELETRNKLVTDENHTLRDELEQINDTVKDAEAKIGLLEASLLGSQQEVRRLENATERALTLERQIAVLEEEQVVLRTTITRTEEEARTTMYRWRQAEKGLNDLQTQLERMEKESREERERHVEAVSRMERQRVMEKELNTAAGRLKGAAAAKSMTDSRSGGNVVSHFVRDLLQDNANLQVGMAELREMLISSNDEIQMLREQLMYHQPADGHEPGSQPTTLQAELANKEPPTPPQAPRVSQELHVHHHYHVSHKAETRKPKKRRVGLTPGVFTPPQLSAPSSPIMSTGRFQRAAAAGSVDSPARHLAHWSGHSDHEPEFAPSSAPSSPRSTNRDSVFDRVPNLPSPASPNTSVDPTSPSWRYAHKKKVSEFSLRSISETAMFGADLPYTSSHSSPSHAQRQHPFTRLLMAGQPTTSLSPVPYTTDDVPSVSPAPLSTYTDYDDHTDVPSEDQGSPTASEFDSSVEQRPRGLQRVISHESIMSLSNGLDIHTLRARPSQLSLQHIGMTTAGTNLSAVTARPTLTSGSAGGKRGSVILRDSIAQSLSAPKSRRSSRATSNPLRGREDEQEGDRNTPRAPSALGKLVSWRPWGGNNSNPDAIKDTDALPATSPSSTPMLAASPPISTTAVPALSLATTIDSPTTSLASPVLSTMSKSPQGSFISAGAVSSTPSTAASANAALSAVFRAPGINQPGLVPGFQEYWAAQKRRGAASSSIYGNSQPSIQRAAEEPR
ncbi:uncharacterized protein C8A04DRAFT_38062 [Dichotomopilus funicola]|uniref:Uncharacterized protein n=1 Tax=Dichotomopilus funicola TaxID=1934379 RepID=A0AAN6V0L8_9PEZI|nr:hypothetical protein C8A04DRAFT_38062 [Dichotomopilus funicola]